MDDIDKTTSGSPKLPHETNTDRIEKTRTTTRMSIVAPSYNILETSISEDTESSLELKEFYVSHYSDPYSYPYHQFYPDSSSYSLLEAASSANMYSRDQTKTSPSYVIRMPLSSSYTSSVPANKFTRKRERVKHSNSNQTLFKFTK